MRNPYRSIATITLIGVLGCGGHDRGGQLDAVFRLGDWEATESSQACRVLGREEMIHVDPQPVLAAEDLLGATVVFKSNRPVLELTFSETGRIQLANLTTANQHRWLCFFVDDELLSAAVIAGRIEEGVLRFGGAFSDSRAFEIAEGINRATRKNLE